MATGPHSAAHDFAGEQIQHHRQIQPDLICPEECKVCNPCLVGLVQLKLEVQGGIPVSVGKTAIYPELLYSTQQTPILNRMWTVGLLLPGIKAAPMDI